MPRSVVLVALLSLAACGVDVMEATTGLADDGGDDDASTTTVGSTTVTMSTSATESGASESTTTGEDGAATETGGTTGPATSDTEAPTETGTPATATEDSTTDPDEVTTEPPVDCAALDADACEDENDCRVVEGQPFVHLMGSHWCLDPLAFAGCIADQECGDAETVACDEGPAWVFATDCLPDGWSVCAAPNEPDGDCD